MNIHIFGHSICRRQRPNQQPHFVDILFEKYNLPDKNLHLAACGSEERILYFLKKTPNIDVAIIFHGRTNHYFVPTIDRDFDLDNGNNEWHNDGYPVEYHPNRIIDSSKEMIESIPRSKIRNALDEYLKYLHTRDLQRNRYQGALMQIDQYLTYKKIPVIHCPYKETIPNWFKFTSGIVDYKIANFQNDDKINPADMWNRVSPEDNILIANILDEYVSKLVPCP